MSISKQELIEVLAANNRASRENGSDIWDVLLKIGVSVSTTGIVALAGLIASFNNDINTLTIQQQYAAEQMKELQVKLDRFTQQERFTLDQFRSEIEPLVQKVEKHELSLAGRSEWMDKINSRLSKAEAEIELIKRTR